jgi:acetyl esterase/lipase
VSLIRRPLNLYLRLTEKPHMMRAKTPDALRKPFEAKARIFFHPPRGTGYVRGDVAGVPVTWAMARNVTESDGPLILYFHGGGYIFGSPATHRAMLARLSSYSGLPACLPDYCKAPEHPFPAAIEDALTVYRGVMDRPGGVILGGDSAGGGIALALLADIQRLGLVRPLGCFALSPLTDLTFSGASVARNADREVILPAARTDELVQMYLQGVEPEDPRASPLWASFAGAPPVWLCAGDTEILLDDARRMAEALRAQGVAVTEVIEHDLPHVWPLFQTLLPEARATLRDIAGWIRSLSPPTGGS